VSLAELRLARNDIIIKQEAHMYYSPTPMHIPDGFLTIAVSLICWAITISLLAIAIRKTNKILGEKQVPLMGIMAAFIFAAQMLNFPVAGGTSGHLLGGALAAIVLGPWAAMLVMTAVIAVQGLLFQDGGLIVMGANILNMGLLTTIVGYGLYRIVSKNNATTRLAISGVAAWLSVMTGALATALQLWLSGTAKLNIVVPAMLGVHALIGLGEALITVAALAFIFRTRPDLLDESSVSAQGSRGWVSAGVLLTLVVVLLSPFASASPDGLERVAKDMGFLKAGQAAPFHIIPDYTIPFLGSTPLSTILAGALGVIIVLGVAFLLGRSLRKKTE
jgi:cobalt/nickel transport system permease protein